MYSLLVQFVGSTDQDFGFSVKPYDILLALQQLADDEPKNPALVPELDYLVYFLMATLQEYNSNSVGLKLVLLKKMEKPAFIVAHKTQKD